MDPVQYCPSSQAPSDLLRGTCWSSAVPGIQAEPRAGAQGLAGAMGGARGSSAADTRHPQGHVAALKRRDTNQLSEFFKQQPGAGSSLEASGSAETDL